MFILNYLTTRQQEGIDPGTMIGGAKVAFNYRTASINNTTTTDIPTRNSQEIAAADAVRGSKPSVAASCNTNISCTVAFTIVAATATSSVPSNCHIDLVTLPLHLLAVEGAHLQLHLRPTLPAKLLLNLQSALRPQAISEAMGPVLCMSEKLLKSLPSLLKLLAAIQVVACTRQNVIAALNFLSLYQLGLLLMMSRCKTRYLLVNSLRLLHLQRLLLFSPALLLNRLQSKILEDLLKAPLHSVRK